MCDDWDDLIEYVVQKFLRNFQTTGGFDVGSPHRSGSGSQEGSRSMESEHQPGFDMENRGSASAGDDDIFFDTPATDIDSLKGRLMDSGLFYSIFLVQSKVLLINLNNRISETIGLDSVLFIGCLFCPAGNVRRRRVP